VSDTSGCRSRFKIVCNFIVIYVYNLLLLPNLIEVGAVLPVLLSACMAYQDSFTLLYHVQTSSEAHTTTMVAGRSF